MKTKRIQELNNMKQQRISELDGILTNRDLLKARFSVTKFYYELDDKQKKECQRALQYASVPIPELNVIFKAPKQHKSLIERFVLHPMTVALSVYLFIILSTIILTLKLY